MMESDASPEREYDDTAPLKETRRTPTRAFRSGALTIAALLIVSGIFYSRARSFGPSSSLGADPGNIMRQRAFGSCVAPVRAPLRWSSSESTGNSICCHNRDYAEYFGYWQSTQFPFTQPASGEITFFDSVTGRPLFIAPRGRSYDSFVSESTRHGWPSFRDEEVLWDNVRVLPDGETVSVNGTHLGHNLPDYSGNRYCINIVCVAAEPAAKLVLR
jgi:peptide methionine sulfoxide reductase MsrB